MLISEEMPARVFQREAGKGMSSCRGNARSTWVCALSTAWAQEPAIKGTTARAKVSAECRVEEPGESLSDVKGAETSPALLIWQIYQRAWDSHFMNILCLGPKCWLFLFFLFFFNYCSKIYVTPNFPF